MEHISGGVCAAKGFKASGVHCGVRKNRTKRDLSMIFSEVPASAAAVYTQNLVKGAPIYVTQRNIADGVAQLALCNSGNANTCNADGEAVAWQMCQLAAEASGVKPEDVIVASTGVIGQPLPIEPIARGVKPLFEALSADGSHDAAEGIMTTDTRLKEVAVSFSVDGVTCVLGGIAKGSGMIHPNLATMLVFLTCDAAISPAMLRKALSEDVKDTFNMVSVDGDTSTNDMVSIMANGLAGNKLIDSEGEAYDAFCAALNEVTSTLCRMIARDGEGASRLLTCEVRGAKTLKDARLCAKSVVCSSLFKAAVFGADANWGRVLCALGYSGAELNVAAVDVTFRSSAGSITVCSMGSSVDFSEELAKQILLEDEVEVLITLRDGEASATAWGCDLTYDYVKINGDYRT
ncbi:MAG: bifunctional glutamate N-acetyltransferase/amino-acid acetyltransferase ArgJ [Clostridia bacterium]|nr:bifunctional glutamate N-acetyltransferase/amino-acid acetyltransferase ArgJ [Clostridia bacterium]